MLMTTACGSVGFYTAEPLEAWVVDADTKRPIPGVIVVSYWDYRYGRLENHHWITDVRETVTDAEGRFYFAGWGPKAVPEEVRGEWNPRLENDDPGILLFHPAYVSKELGNSRPMYELNSFGPSVRKSEWSSKRIELKQLSEDLRARKLSLATADSVVDRLSEPHNTRGGVPVPLLCAALAKSVSEHTTRVAAAGKARTAYEAYLSSLCSKYERRAK